MKKSKCQFCGQGTTGCLYITDKETQTDIILCFDCWFAVKNMKVLDDEVVYIDDIPLTSLEYHEEEGRLGIL